ncbi:MAG: XAC2610-related protein [Pyrinomonadaceae bacterium]
MKKLTFALVLLFATSAFAQKTFDLKDASKFFDIKVKVAECDDMYCKGKATFSFYKKGGDKPYQVISLPDTEIELGEGGQPEVNATMLYDKQSVVNVGDFNFDGMEDVAVCTGHNGPYGVPSYNVYLSSKAAKKFVYDAAFTKTLISLGMFDVDKEKKTLQTFNKDGCCWHITERYDVVAGRLRKIFEEVEDALIKDETKIKVTTKTLVNGKWKTSVKYVKREE